METEIPEPWLSVVVEKQDVRYVVDLKRKHFRTLTSPYEVIECDGWMQARGDWMRAVWPIPRYGCEAIDADERPDRSSRGVRMGDERND